MQQTRRDFLTAGAGAILGGYFLHVWDSPAFGKDHKQAMLWVEAKDFTDYGGWRLDTQFIDWMGSACLLAASTGSPVKDASTVTNIPTAGKYRLLVRCKNWLKEYSPGRFRVSFNGSDIQETFGATMDERWLWEPGGEHELAEGNLKISIKDETGHFGRFASIILTTDPDYIPPDDIEGIRLQREKMTGISLEPETESDWDVIVAGAGLAGCCAAIAAARMGAQTVLIDRWDKLGGNAYLGVPPQGASCCFPNARETGIIEEISRIKAFFRTSNSDAVTRLADLEPNLTLIHDQIIIEAEKDGDRVSSVKTIGRLKNTTDIYRAKVFVDCTGDGNVGYYVGAEYRMGREARKEFSEPLAPEKADSIMMSSVLFKEAFVYKAADTGSESPFVAPPWAYRFPSEEDMHRNIGNITYGNWWFEHRGTINELEQMELSRDDLLRITFGYWDFIKNVWSGREKAKNYALTTVATTMAKRETRRLMGDHVLTQHDVQGDTFFEDRVSYGGWTLDIHHPEGIFSGKEGPYHFAKETALYSIPFRCLYSTNIDNLLFAGRDMSVTHVAFGTVRVQKTLACMGQVVGIAAAMCVEKDVLPRELGQRYIRQLQQNCLKNDLYITKLGNADGDDLARGCKAAASSIDSSEIFNRLSCRTTGWLGLDRSRGMVIRRGLNEKLGVITLQLSTNRPDETEITLQLRGVQDPGDPLSGEDIGSVTATIQPDYSKSVPGWNKKEGFHHWVKFAVDKATKYPYLWITLPQTEKIWWGVMSEAPNGSHRSQADISGDKWSFIADEYHTFYTDPAIVTVGETPGSRDCRAENVINGVTRIEGEALNMWASDPRMPMPQWVELDFGKAVRFNKMQLVFDTNLDVNDAALADFRPQECVRDYKLSYPDGDKWIDFVEVKDNFQRFRVHEFSAVEASKIRLTVLSTYGDLSGRVYEIRVYNDA